MTRASAPSAPAAPKMSKPPAKTKGEADAEPNWPPPLQPRRGLLIALLCVFAVWVGVLLWMYFTKTAHPSEPATKPSPALVMLSNCEESPLRRIAPRGSGGFRSMSETFR